jgi:MYXO-CTERM domain-containing protein
VTGGTTAVGGSPNGKGGTNSFAVGGSVSGTGGAAAGATLASSPGEDSGCSCQVTGTTRTGWSTFGPALLGLLMLTTRKRRSR